MMFRTTLTSTILVLASGTLAYAEEAAPQPMEAEFCFQTDRMGKTLRKAAEMKPDKRDRVGFSMRMSFDLEDGELPPERAELRDAETVLAAFAITPEPSGLYRTPNLNDALVNSDETASLCVVDPAREGRMSDAIGYEFGIGMGVSWLETTGTHSVAEIEDALKDGRSHYKILAGPMGFMVPKFTHVSVSGPDDANPPALIVTAKGADVATLDGELYDGSRFVSLKEIKAAGGDGIRVEGDYEIGPAPDVKTVRRFSE